MSKQVPSEPVTLYCSRGLPFTVSAEDAERVAAHGWSLYGAGKYLHSSFQKKTISLHRFIMDPPKGMEVDHISGDTRDYTRGNLRVCTRAENARNKPKARPSASGFKGVYRAACGPKKPWAARITIGKKNLYLGKYETPEEAYSAYCKAAREIHGEFARIA